VIVSDGSVGDGWQPQEPSQSPLSQSELFIIKYIPSQARPTQSISITKLITHPDNIITIAASGNATKNPILAEGQFALLSLDFTCINSGSVTVTTHMTVPGHDDVIWAFEKSCERMQFSSLLSPYSDPFFQLTDSLI